MTKAGGSGRAVTKVAEDKPLLRIMPAKLADDPGFDVEETANAVEAPAILEWRTNIRIVFSDIVPGARDGMRLAAHRLRRDLQHIRRDKVTFPARSLIYATLYGRRCVARSVHRMAA